MKIGLRCGKVQKIERDARGYRVELRKILFHHRIRMFRSLIILLWLSCLPLRAELSEAEKARAIKFYQYAKEGVPPSGFDHSRLRDLLQEERDLLLQYLREN